MRPRLHLVGLPHTTTTDDITVCAYTAKATKFCRMMENDRVVLYWGERSDTPAEELVTLHTEEERQAWYPGLNPGNVATLGGSWDYTQEPWRVTNERAIAALRERVEPQDLILLAGGWAHHPIAHAFPAHTVVEYGVGYYGWFTNYVAFESHAWRHHCYGKNNIQDGRWYDTVIPNYFDPAELPLGRDGGDYLAYLGRLIARKGLAAAADVAKAVEMPLVVAGPGAAEVSEGLIVCEDGSRIEGDVHYIGTVGLEQRAELLGNALALLSPTGYIEPFGGVAVEAQMCGTPAITSDWGAFTETVEDKYRFRTLKEGVACVETARTEKATRLRNRAVSRWSLNAVRPQYERWFDALGELWGRGWYAL